MYETLITKKGQELLALALSANTQVALKEIRFSDYSGAINENMSVLAGIKHTQDITSNTIDSLNSNTIIIETLIPSNVGGFYIETIGVYTDKGELFALAKINSTYKPLLSENLATDLHIKLYLQVGNATNVALNIDESVVLSSREYVNTKLLVIKNEFENSQELQDSVINTNNTNLLTQLALQNTQMSNLMMQCQNLTTKLELGGGKVGMIYMFAGDKVPDNYMLCDGRELSKAEYPQLFSAIGTIYGESADTLSFKIPDLRGCFTRCVGGNAAPLGMKQNDAIRNIVGEVGTNHSLALFNSNGFSGVFTSANGGSGSVGGTTGWYYRGFNFNASRVVPTAEENRPVNMALNYIIQVKE